VTPRLGSAEQRRKTPAPALAYRKIITLLAKVLTGGMR